MVIVNVVHKLIIGAFSVKCLGESWLWRILIHFNPFSDSFPLQYKDHLFRHRDSHYKNKMVVTTSCVYNRNFFVDKMTCLYWAGTLYILKQKYHHFDEIFNTVLTGNCHFDKYWSCQWWKFHQNDNISVLMVQCSTSNEMWAPFCCALFHFGYTVWLYCNIVVNHLTGYSTKMRRQHLDQKWKVL